MGETFCVTGMGRTGTKFLARALNQSPTWTVQHEPAEAGGAARAGHHLFQIRRWKDKDHYGEVNSYMRWVFMDLPVSRRAVLIRHPYDLTRAIWNRKKGSLPIQIKRQLLQVHQLLHSYILAGVRPFFFEHYTRDVNTVVQLAEHVGITDLSLPPNYCDRPVNATPAARVHAKKFEDLPADDRAWARRSMEWFCEAYYDRRGMPLT